MKGYTAFNVEQIEGLPERYYAKAEPRLDPVQRIARADAFFAATGADIRHGGNQAYYTMAQDYVQMPPFESFRDAESYYATLAHECTHWTRHPSRLERDFGRKRWGDEGYAMEELVAELGSAFVSADLDLTPEPREDHAAYIASWLKVLKNDKRAIFTAAGHAQRGASSRQRRCRRGRPSRRTRFSRGQGRQFGIVPARAVPSWALCQAAASRVRGCRVSQSISCPLLPRLRPRFARRDRRGHLSRSRGPCRPRLQEPQSRYCPKGDAYAGADFRRRKGSGRFPARGSGLFRFPRGRTEEWRYRAHVPCRSALPGQAARLADPDRAASGRGDDEPSRSIYSFDGLMRMIVSLLNGIRSSSRLSDGGWESGSSLAFLSRRCPPRQYAVPRVRQAVMPSSRLVGGTTSQTASAGAGPISRPLLKCRSCPSGVTTAGPSGLSSRRSELRCTMTVPSLPATA